MATILGFEIIDHNNVTSIGVTVPADTEMCMVFWGGYMPAASTMTSLTIDSSNFTILQNNYDTGGIYNGCAWLDAPSTGAQTLSWVDTFSNEGVMAIVYFDDVDGATDVRATDTDSNTGTTTLSTTVTSNSDDTVIGFLISYPPTNPDGAQTGQTVLTGADNDTTGVSYVLDLFEVDSPGASTTTATGDAEYGALVTASVAQSGGGGGGTSTPQGLQSLTVQFAEQRTARLGGELEQ